MALSRAPVAKPCLGGSAVKAAAPSKAPLKVCAVQRPVETAKSFVENVAQNAGKLAAALAATSLVAGSASALTFDELQALSYMEVKGTGLANVCPVVGDGAGDAKSLKSGSYKLSRFCLEPTEFKVKEESQFKGGSTEFVPTKLMTRLTYTLDGMEGSFAVDGSGAVQLKENDDGINFAPVTVQLPGGERVPFLFTAKLLDAKGNADNFVGNFVVPSYRGSSFLDPKGRGGSTGYDNAVALPARSDADEFAKENVKVVAPLVGKMRLAVAAYNPETGEVGGVFESIQPSDTDLGSKAPKDIKVTGLWYAQLN